MPGLLRVERISQGEQVVVVGSATVMEDEQPVRDPVRRPLEAAQPAQGDTSRRCSRGLTTGVSERSRTGRRGSCIRGSLRASPR
jgi:hypothetical protein